MKNIIVLLTVLASLLTFQAGAVQTKLHKYKRNHHYKAHKIHKPRGRIDATYQN